MPHHPEQIKKYILQAVEQIEPVDEIEIQDKKRIKNFLVLHPENFYDRKNFKGHITASGIIFNDDKILFVRHKKLNRWLQPGGHCEEGEMPYEAAIREIKEETGLLKLDPKHLDENNIPKPFYCNVHQIPENLDENEHQHLDLLYVFDAKDAENVSPNNEIMDIKWFDKNEAKKINTTAGKVLLKLLGKIII